MKTSLLKIVAAVGLGCVIATPAMAEETYKYELTSAVGYNFYDNDRNLDDSAFVGYGFGFNINPKWTIESWLTYSETDLDSNSAIDVDSLSYRIDALYHLPKFGAWTPYLVGGIGRNQFDVEGAVAADFNETQLNGGIGLKRKVYKNIGIRGDVRAFDNIDQGDNADSGTDYALQLALTYAFGKRGYTPVESKPAPLDTDGDGVLDTADLCPKTPSGVKVNSRGCPLDTDRDGVYDYQDKCPNTARNLKVDSVGCPIQLTDVAEITLAVKFDTNKAIVKSEYFDEIKRVATFMNQYENTKVVVVGHTDARGSASYNQALSERRAAAVAAVLVREHGVSSSRVSSRGAGESAPIASNDTEEGRAQNRRVVGEVSAKIQKYIEK